MLRETLKENSKEGRRRWEKNYRKYVIPGDSCLSLNFTALHASEKRSFANSFNKPCLNTSSAPGHRPCSRVRAEADLGLPSGHSQHCTPSRGSKPLCPRTTRRRKGRLSRVPRDDEECVSVAFHRETNALKGTGAKQRVWRVTSRSVSPEHQDRRQDSSGHASCPQVTRSLQSSWFKSLSLQVQSLVLGEGK